MDKLVPIGMLPKGSCVHFKDTLPGPETRTNYYKIHGSKNQKIFHERLYVPILAYGYVQNSNDINPRCNTFKITNPSHGYIDARLPVLLKNKNNWTYKNRKRRKKLT